MKNSTNDGVFMTIVDEIFPLRNSKRRIGGYTVKERRERIARYKNKLIRWRQAHPVSKKFSGRSKVAASKPRVNGRFVKKTDMGKEKRRH